MEVILSWVKSGLLFAVFASVILMLSPNKAYMKHISLVVGMLFILVMLHPIMELFHLDEKTYLSYVENLLRLEQMQDGISDDQLQLYEESVGLNLLAVFREKGYLVDAVNIQADAYGTVEQVEISFCGDATGIEYVESYLKSLFGSEVAIRYENKAGE